jgi:hypothetical protein
LANHVLNALALTGTAADLQRFQAALLVDHGTEWGLSCSQAPVERTSANGQIVLVDRSRSAWEPRWVTNAPTSAIVSFWTTWEPNTAILNAIGTLAADHGVAVLHGAAIEEYFDGVVPQIWEGEGLQMAQVAAPSPRAELLVAQCGHPVKSHRLASVVHRLDVAQARFAA